MYNQISGKRGEDIAVKYLKKNNYLVIERNFRTRNGEIDLIAIDRNTKDKILVCVEVKLRKGDHYGSAREAITYFKLRALERTLLYYQSLHPDLPSALRIDLIAIQEEVDGKIGIELVKNISE